MTEQNPAPGQGPQFVRRVRRPARAEHPVEPGPEPVSPAKPAGPKRKPASTAKQVAQAQQNEAAVKQQQQLLDALQQVKELQQVVRQVQEVKVERVSFWKQHGILIASCLLLLGFYFYQRWQTVTDQDQDPDQGITAVQRLPETLEKFYDQDRASKAKILRELAGMTFPDDPAKLKWFNDRAAGQLEKDSEPVVDDLAEIIFTGKVIEAAKALEN